MSDLPHIIESQQELLAGLARAEAGEVKVADLKPLSGVFGILPQRNDLFAARVRVTGGELAVADMVFLAGLAKRVKPSYVHFSSRQNVQFHDVTPAGAAAVIRECTAHELPFRGGGGDSFRNISASIGSGVFRDRSADLVPYARYLTDIIFDWDEAFRLPRKLKIGFASGADFALALRQDLGFLAVRSGGRYGFEVYGGGGFGRNPATGVKLLDFIEPRELPRAARAMVELFSEHGDRTNRAVARIRYIAERLGREEFVKLYMGYYDRLAGADYPAPPDFPADWNRRNPAVFRQNSTVDSGFRRWRRLAAKRTRFPGEYSVTLFVPRGVLSVKEFALLAALLERFKVPAVRLTFEQNVMIPAIAEEALPKLYAALKKFPADLVFASFRGRVSSCIGVTVCKPGILDAPRHAAGVEAALDGYFRKHPEQFTAKRVNMIATGLHMSGCPNSCSSHQASRFGLQGTRKRVGEELADGFTVWSNPGGAAIGEEDREFVPASELPERVLELLREAGILGGRE